MIQTLEGFCVIKIDEIGDLRPKPIRRKERPLGIKLTNTGSWSRSDGVFPRRRDGIC